MRWVYQAKTSSGTKVREMRKWLSACLGLIDDNRAVTAIEYGMIAALIVAVIVAAVTQLGMQTNSFWVKANGAL